MLPQPTSANRPALPIKMTSSNPCARTRVPWRTEHTERQAFLVYFLFLLVPSCSQTKLTAISMVAALKENVTWWNITTLDAGQLQPESTSEGDLDIACKGCLQLRCCSKIPLEALFKKFFEVNGSQRAPPKEKKHLFPTFWAGQF